MENGPWAGVEMRSAGLGVSGDVGVFVLSFSTLPTLPLDLGATRASTGRHEGGYC